MSNSNQQTIDSYEGHVQEYIEGTPQDVSGIVKVWLDTALSRLPKDARILEFGSATGRDAAYIKDQGWEVQCTDATQAFVDMLNEKGFNAHRLNAITDPIEGTYDLILANAVLLHFTREELAHVLKKMLQALTDDGIFAFTLKYGEGEEWSESKLGAPRYFCFWSEETIRDALNTAGFQNAAITVDTGSRDVKWLQIIANK